MYLFAGIWPYAIMQAMRYLFLLSLIIIIVHSTAAFAFSVDSPLIFSKQETLPYFDNLEISVADINVAYLNVDSGHWQLRLDIVYANQSPYQKLDIDAPFSIAVYDEFHNEYFMTEQAGTSGFTLYPSETRTQHYLFEAPVAAAKNLYVVISQEESGFRAELPIKTAEIRHWDELAAEPALSNNDLIIVFPRDKMAFARGEKLYLKVDFSARAGRPEHIHVVLPNYMLTDDQAKGQYEVVIPDDLPEGDLPVIIMGEWGKSPDSTIISKTVFVKIKG